MKKVKDWADNLCPCEAPGICNSFGVCDGCCERDLIMAGAAKVCSILFDGSPTETAIKVEK